MIMGSYTQVEIEHGDYRQASTEQIGFVEGADVGNVSAGEHADTYAYIPRREVSGGGSTPLVVGFLNREKYKKVVTKRASRYTL